MHENLIISSAEEQQMNRRQKLVIHCGSWWIIGSTIFWLGWYYLKYKFILYSAITITSLPIVLIALFTFS